MIMGYNSVCATIPRAVFAPSGAWALVLGVRASENVARDSGARLSVRAHVSLCF